LKYIYLICFFLFTSSLPAQQAAPELLCIGNGLVQWNTPPVSCGPFVSYELYSSQNSTGPFNLIATITNQAQSSYLDNVPAGQTWYYFMKTIVNCPGITSLQSNTINNLPLPTIPIQVVSVSGGFAEIKWNLPSGFLNLGYIILKSTANGTVPIDTVFNGNSFIDLTSDPANKQEIYYVRALDPCFNSSVFDLPHYTILTKESIDPCRQSLDIEWTPYENWVNGVARYDVYASTNFGPDILVGSTSGSTLKFSIPNLTNSSFVCYFVQAVENGSNVISNSPIRCNVVQVNTPVLWLNPIQADILPNGNIDLQWSWNTDADLVKTEVCAQLNPPSCIVTQAQDITLVSSPQLMELSNLPVSKGPIWFNINTLDQCNNIIKSETVSTIFLKAKAGDNRVNQLNWEFNSPLYFNWFSTRLVTTNIGGAINSQLFPATIVEYKDEVDIDRPDEQKLCYFVIAEGRVELPDGDNITTSIRSNIVCLEQKSKLLFPNAFAPDGLNFEFKPIGVFILDISYDLQIFDRWGKLVFESADINKGWTGQINGISAPTGLYTYRAQVKNAGVTEDYTGQVMLVR